MSWNVGPGATSFDPITGKQLNGTYARRHMISNRTCGLVRIRMRRQISNRRLEYVWWRTSTVEQREQRTRGKVISRLARILDFAENLIFLGRLEQVWQRLIDKAELSRGERVVDVGCGTGKVPIVAADMVLPGGEVVGIDASTEMIAMSRKRAREANVDVAFRQSVMEDLPFPDGYFDVVLSCQALHHVPRDAKFQALSEMRRVLKPGGRLLLLDHGEPYRWYLKILFYPFRWNVLEYQAENFRGQIPEMIASVFGNVEEADRFFGWMRTWRAVKS